MNTEQPEKQPASAAPTKVWRFCTNETESAIVCAEPDSPEFWPSSKWTYLSRSARTEAELIQREQIQPACAECGQPYDTTTDFQQSIAANTCFACLRWVRVLTECCTPDFVRIDGSQYWVGPADWTKPYNLRGFDGRRFRIQRLADGAVIDTDNLWLVGRFPAHFRSRLPDNAIFLELT